ncbi:unnamed protein product, partial [Phaeothamnion confervicola]
ARRFPGTFVPSRRALEFISSTGHPRGQRRPDRTDPPFFRQAASGHAARYANHAAVGARKARFLSAVQSKSPQPADILDFGCGSSDIAPHLSAAGHRFTGYDRSASMTEQARRSDHDQKVQWNARAADATDALPFADATFDAVVTSSALEYVPKLDATLNELARVLRPAGWLFATVPDMRYPVRHRERWLKLAVTIPGMASLLAMARRRGLLRISINRLAAEGWQSRMLA